MSIRPVGLVIFYQLPLEEKIATIAKEIYGADGIEIQEMAQQRIDLYKKQVCINFFYISFRNLIMASIVQMYEFVYVSVC